MIPRVNAGSGRRRTGCLSVGDISMFERGSTRVCQACSRIAGAESEAEIAEDTEPARASRFVQARQTQAAVGCVKPDRRARTGK